MEKLKNYTYLFGPVPSRRFGRSLGVDLVPLKTCSFDCIFCQLGRTTNKTLKQLEYVPVDTVMDELQDWLRTDGTADFITLSGSGEPTLNSGFGRVIDALRNATEIPIVVLTNGTLLNEPSVRADLAKADIVKVSLSVWNPFLLEYINRPVKNLNLNELVRNVSVFRNEFPHDLWIEVFLVWGFNTMPGDVSRIAALVNDIKPDRVQLNTAVRPPAEKFVTAAPRSEMKKLTELFEPQAEVITEVVMDTTPRCSANADNILAMLERRPSTGDQIEQAFGMHKNEAAKYIGYLLWKGEIQADYRNHETYYTRWSTKELHNVGA